MSRLPHATPLFRTTEIRRIEARRVWGAETPIEMFVIQALAKEKLFPACQMLIMRDGATFPSWYHLWNDLEFRHTDGLAPRFSTTTDLQNRTIPRQDHQPHLRSTPQRRPIHPLYFL